MQVAGVQSLLSGKHCAHSCLLEWSSPIHHTRSYNRCGCPAPDPQDASGPTFFLIKGSSIKEGYDTKFLQSHGVSVGSLVVATENAYLTDEAWKKICPELRNGIRFNIRRAGSRLGITQEEADKLWVVLALDGFKSHTKNFRELIDFAEHRVTVLCEDRDSSHVNQAFDKYVVSAVASGQKIYLHIQRHLSCLLKANPFCAFLWRLRG